MELNERKQKILQAIIQDYITSAEPVGSRTIARKYDLGISAATIRNEMFDLEMMGYLEQPHTSAGRIPSIKGYRFYVDCLLKPTKITKEEKRLVETWFNEKMSDVDQIFQLTAKGLAQITHNVSLVMTSQQAGEKLKYIRFLPLDHRRAIMIVVTDTGHIENCVYSNDSGVDVDDLNVVAQKLTQCLSGVRLDQIDIKLLNSFRDSVVDDLDLYRTAFRSLQKALRSQQQLYKGGTMELLNKPEFKDVNKAKSLFTMLEEQDVVANILHDDGGSKLKPLTVRIGEETKMSPINDCSIIEATFTAHDKVLGKIAVLGPTRMEYAKIMGLLDFMTEHVTHILEHYHDDK
ncbi:MAG: heat-inducible transcriptional repressor HrcA [Caecibacter sp.]|jgi:heat-inducible transcriptional repressor|nr:heat-inducible transcription repressor HrcA [Megasphaera sp.]MEE0722045.1 heat-inducible transcriptional repressor HrcA [Caecibacter sp.]